MHSSLKSKKIIITGATSGIGRELARQLSDRGAILGITGRRTHLLEELSNELKTRVHTRQMDVSKPDKARTQLEQLITEMGGLDIIILNAGVSLKSKELAWDDERQMIDTNVTGFCSLLNTAFHQFVNQGHGHIVGISSVAGLLPNPGSMGYNASKAFVSNYLQGVRLRLNKLKLPVAVTDVLPGYVHTPMTEHRKQKFWVSPVEKAAQQIIRAIEKRKFKVYVTRRYFWIAMLLNIIPQRVWYWLSK